jgi:RHS repeat-associated protein
MNGPTVNATFIYDGLGRREKKTINSNVTEFLYDGLNPVQETDGSTILANILPGLGIDEFLTRTDTVAGVTSAFLTDGLRSTVALTASAGTVEAEYTYDPFGKTTATGVSSSNSFQYTGRENDGSGLYYYRMRYYSPELQRFVSEDPYLHPIYGKCPAVGLTPAIVNLVSIALDNPQNLSTYGYVGNNPLRYIDPFGLERCDPLSSSCGPSPDACSQYPLDSALRYICENTPDSPWNNCVRKCLRDAYLDCSTLRCIAGDHLVCWVVCLRS